MSEPGLSGAQVKIYNFFIIHTTFLNIQEYFSHFSGQNHREYILV